MSACKEGEGIGTYRHSIQLQSFVDTPDDHGGFDRVWSDDFKVRCSVEDKSGNESFGDDKFNTETTIIVKTRFRSDINTKQRIIFDGKNYNIRHVDDVKRMRKKLKITADLEADQDE